LIVPPRKARLIMRGDTQHRRLTPLAAKVGHDIPITPGQGKAPLGRARIVAAMEQRLGDISYQEARAEGHRTTDDFKAQWVADNDRGWIGTNDLDDAALIARFDRRWANTIVQVLELHPVADEPRYLASQADILNGRTNDGEYVLARGRAIDDLEVIDDATADRYAKAAGIVAEGQRMERNQADQDAYRQHRHRKRNARLAIFGKAA
jgi:hypothetical protein